MLIGMNVTEAIRKELKLLDELSRRFASTHDSYGASTMARVAARIWRFENDHPALAKEWQASETSGLNFAAARYRSAVARLAKFREAEPNLLAKAEADLHEQLADQNRIAAAIERTEKLLQRDNEQLRAQQRELLAAEKSSGKSSTDAPVPRDWHKPEEAKFWSGCNACGRPEGFCICWR